jgi:hypothetical protein
MNAIVALVAIATVVCLLVVKALRKGAQPTAFEPIPFPGQDGRDASANTSVLRVVDFGRSYPFSEILSDPRLPQVRTIRTRIRGVTKCNRDGTDRQRIIRQCCNSGDALYLTREPNNPADRNAIQIYRIVFSDVPDTPKLGEQLGYLSRELAEELAPRMDERGSVLMAKIKEVTGGKGEYSLGVNIEVEEYGPAHTRRPRSKMLDHAIDSTGHVKP